MWSPWHKRVPSLPLKHIIQQRPDIFGLTWTIKFYTDLWSSPKLNFTLSLEKNWRTNHIQKNPTEIHVQIWKILLFLHKLLLVIFFKNDFHSGLRLSDSTVHIYVQYRITRTALVLWCTIYKASVSYSWELMKKHLKIFLICKSSLYIFNTWLYIKDGFSADTFSQRLSKKTLDKGLHDISLVQISSLVIQ